MDPKTLASLDPKLRETYERVMGGLPSSGSTPSATPVPADTAVQPPAAPAAVPSQATPTAPPLPASPTPEVATSAVDQTPAGQLFSTTAPGAPPIPSTGPAYTPENLGITSPNPVAQPLPPPAPMPGASKSSSSLMRILYIFGGIIFFIAYTYFWIKIFKLPLPF